MQLFHLFSVEKLLQVALFMGFLEQRASRECEFRKTNICNFQPSTILDKNFQNLFAGYFLTNNVDQ